MGFPLGPVYLCCLRASLALLFLMTTAEDPVTFTDLSSSVCILPLCAVMYIVQVLVSKCLSSCRPACVNARHCKSTMLGVLWFEMSVGVFDISVYNFWVSRVLAVIKKLPIIFNFFTAQSSLHVHFAVCSFSRPDA